MTKPKSTIALDDFEHRKAMQQLAAMSQRNNNSTAEQALAKIQSWKDSKKPEKREIPKGLKLKPPALKMKRVLCNVATGKAFREYRVNLGLEAVEIYKLAGLTKEKYHCLEKGSHKWTPSVRTRICNAIYDIMAERADREEAARSLAAIPQ